MVLITLIEASLELAVTAQSGARAPVHRIIAKTYYASSPDRRQGNGRARVWMNRA